MVRHGESNWENRGNGLAAVSAHWRSVAQMQAQSKGRGRLAQQAQWRERIWEAEGFCKRVNFELGREGSEERRGILRRGRVGMLGERYHRKSAGRKGGIKEQDRPGQGSRYGGRCLKRAEDRITAGEESNRETEGPRGMEKEPEW